MIKDQIGEMLTDEVKIKQRWREYFSNLLNVENAREQLGCSGLPIDRIKHLGVSGVDMMHAILKRVWEEEQMPEEWKKSEIVHIYNQKWGPNRSGSSNRYRGGDAEGMVWLTYWDGEQGTKSQHRKNGSDGQ